MEPEFWHQRWQTAQIGFHQPRPNEKLVRYWPGLALEAGSTVFVPLCGKSLDMVWLAGQRLHVIGIELSEIAIDEFFAEQELTPETRTQGPLTVKRAGPYELWCGDFFELTAPIVSHADAVYDRAALVALPPEMRRAYAAHLITLFTAAPAPVFLITLEYDQSIVDGPPHSVPRAEIDALFDTAFTVRERHRALETARTPKFIESGLREVTEVAYVLTPSTHDPARGTETP